MGVARQGRGLRCLTGRAGWAERAVLCVVVWNGAGIELRRAWKASWVVEDQSKQGRAGNMLVDAGNGLKGAGEGVKEDGSWLK